MSKRPHTSPTVGSSLLSGLRYNPTIHQRGRSAVSFLPCLTRPAHHCGGNVSGEECGDDDGDPYAAVGDEWLAEDGEVDPVQHYRDDCSDDTGSDSNARTTCAHVLKIPLVLYELFAGNSNLLITEYRDDTELRGPLRYIVEDVISVRVPIARSNCKKV